MLLTMAKLALTDQDTAEVQRVTMRRQHTNVLDPQGCMQYSRSHTSLLILRTGLQLHLQSHAIRLLLRQVKVQLRGTGAHESSNCNGKISRHAFPSKCCCMVGGDLFWGLVCVFVCVWSFLLSQKYRASLSLRCLKEEINSAREDALSTHSSLLWLCLPL